MINRENAVYVEWNTAIVANGISLNYERRILNVLSLQAGYGASFMPSFDLLEMDTLDTAHGGTVSAKLTFGGDHRFEVGAGAALVFVKIHCNVDQDDTCDESGSERSFRVMPAGSLGYRYQPYGAGLFFRAGLGLSYGFGAGLSTSIGTSF